MDISKMTLTSFCTGLRRVCVDMRMVYVRVLGDTNGELLHMQRILQTVYATYFRHARSYTHLKQ